MLNRNLGDMKNKIEAFIKKSTLIGDKVNITGGKGHLILREYTTKSKVIRIPDYITDIEFSSAFRNCANLEELVLPPIKELAIHSIVVPNDSISKIVIHKETKRINKLFKRKSLEIELLGNVEIREGAISDIGDLKIINSNLIQKVGYYGIDHVGIDELSINKSVLTPNSMVRCIINQLDIQHAQSNYSFRECDIDNVNYYIEELKIKELTDKETLKDYMNNKLFWMCNIGNINIIQI